MSPYDLPKSVFQVERELYIYIYITFFISRKIKASIRICSRKGRLN